MIVMFHYEDDTLEVVTINCSTKDEFETKIEEEKEKRTNVECITYSEKDYMNLK